MDAIRKFLSQPNLPVWMMALATIAIAAYALEQADASRKSLDAAQHFFVNTERPYVGVLVDFSLIGDHIHAHYTVRNFGKSPALHVKQKLMLVNAASVNDFFLKTDVTTTARETIVMPGPDDHPYADIYWPLPKGKKARPSDGYVYAVGRLIYSDGSETPYHTDFCYERLSNGAAFYCGKHNTVE
jgi:hypothetical protein